MSFTRLALHKDNDDKTDNMRRKSPQKFPLGHIYAYPVYIINHSAVVGKLYEKRMMHGNSYNTHLAPQKLYCIHHVWIAYMAEIFLDVQLKFHMLMAVMLMGASVNEVTKCSCDQSADMHIVTVIFVGYFMRYCHMWCIDFIKEMCDIFMIGKAPFKFYMHYVEMYCLFTYTY